MTTAYESAYPRLKGLDLESKVKLLTGATTFTLWPEESLGLSELRLSDGPTGVRGLKFSGGRIVALFPNATLLASAWNEDTTTEVGRLLAEEALAQQIHVVLGPTINLHRSALGGRLFEAFSEDPLLTGKLAAAYVRGMQGERVAACLKHLVANESETDRNSMNSIVDETTLRELYLLPFEIAVDESDPWSIMAAYNDVNGVAATEHDEVNNGIVKGEWGYTGVIMSDWFATKTAAAAANGGLDLVMPGPNGPWGDALVAAVRAGEVDEAVIDDHLDRVLLMADRVGVLGTERGYPLDLPTPDSAERREALTQLAAGGMTVLTNKASVLPLARGARVTLIGRHAIETIDMGGGSAQVNPPYQVSVADGLGHLLGAGVTITDGVEVRTRAVPAKPAFIAHPETGEPGAEITIIGDTGAVLDHRHTTSPFAVVGLDDNFTERVARVRYRARIDSTGLVELGVIGVGDWVLRAADHEHEFHLRPSGGGIGEELLAPPTGAVDVEVSAPTVVEIEATLLGGAGENAPLLGAGAFGLIARLAARPVEDVIAEAAAAAASADVALVVVGLTEEQETEAVDKSTLRLPGDQDRMISAIAAAAQRTVVVVNAATPVLMPWLDEVDAVLWAGLPGQEGGHAIAATLLGDIEPAGRLVTTFPTADGAAPAWSVTPVDGSVTYTEGTFIGYRGHYAGSAPAPLFWLGHGLGYGAWSYDGAELIETRLIKTGLIETGLIETELSETGLSETGVAEAPGSPSVRVQITNTGARASREVVQVYFDPAEDNEPVRLVGWAAATVEPGACATVDVCTDARMWRRWDASTHAWARLSGRGELHVARGLGDIRHTIKV